MSTMISALISSLTIAFIAGVALAYKLGEYNGFKQAHAIIVRRLESVDDQPTYSNDASETIQ